MIKTSLEENTKTITVTSKERIIKPWITDGILRFIRVRNRMQKKVRCNPGNDILRISYKRYRNFCNSLIKKLKNNYYKKQLSVAATNSKLLWKTVNEITHFKSPKVPNTNLLNLKVAPQNSVNWVNRFFSEIGKSLAETIIKKSISQASARRIFTNSHMSSFVLLHTTPCEIETTLMNLDSNSATGWDNIPTRFLKISKHIVVPLICDLKLKL